MANRTKRTQVDEDKFDAELRREEAIKSEVIVELRDSNVELRTGLIATLERLIAVSEEAQNYRRQVLASLRRTAEQPTDCVPGCRRHRWDTSDGWHRRDAGGVS